MKGTYAYNVVIDLEFTPVPKSCRQGGLMSEIIEVGAVKLTSEGAKAGEFSCMVRPALAKTVSGKVHQMTGIGREDLTCAKPLAEVLDELSAWIGPDKARMVTWSGCDLRQIRAECAYKGIDCCLPGRWLDIQRLYPRLMGTRKRLVALGEAADWCGIANDKASAHRALYDAQMTADLFCMMARGECAAQRKALEAELHKEECACSASIAEQCGGLAELLARLQAEEGLAA